VRKFVSLLAEGRCLDGLFPNTLYNASGFSPPLLKTDFHHITEKLLSMAKNDKQTNYQMKDSLSLREDNCKIQKEMYSVVSRPI
jgi:hypothetical protein